MRSDKVLAQQYKVPSHLRRYAKRYGVDVETIISTWKKHNKQRQNLQVL